MKGILGVLTASVIILFVFAAPVQADELSELKEQIRQQQEILKKMEARIAELEAKQAQQEVKVSQIEETHSNGSSGGGSWFEDTQLSGDFRYRHETIDAAGSEGRNRHRIRVRVGLDSKVNDEVDFHMRVASGSQDPVSTNETLDGGFSSKDIWLDRAYVDYHPAWCEGTNVWAGKMGNPFFTPGKTDLIWDSDLNPEGGAWKYEYKHSDDLTFFSNLGAFWVEEQGSDVDESMWGAQVGARYHINEDNNVVVGMGYFDYSSLEGEPLIENDYARINNITTSGGMQTRRAFGNTANGQLYMYDYNLLEVFGEYNTKVNGMPVAIFGDYVKNIAANVANDTGYLFGFRLNKAKAPGSWQAHYDYRYLESDAVVGAFTDSDFIGGGTGGQGHKFGFAYQFTRNIQGVVSYFLNERTVSSGQFDNNYRRLQLDVKMKF